MALWFIPGAGQAAFLLQASLALFDAMDVIEGLKRYEENLWRPGGKAQKWPGQVCKLLLHDAIRAGQGPPILSSLHKKGAFSSLSASARSTNNGSCRALVVEEACLAPMFHPSFA